MAFVESGDERLCKRAHDGQISSLYSTQTSPESTVQGESGSA